MSDDYEDLSETRICCQQCGVPIDTVVDPYEPGSDVHAHFCSEDCHRKSEVGGTRIE